jgi:TonB-dependent SusC/RagA subfamily outer membrane receptor
LQFYHFLYPESGAFYEYQPAPGGLTQLAPFVVDSGRVQAPIAVYVDGEPVYIHDVNQDQRYTAVADSGFHTVSIRTSRQLVTLREVYLKHLHKLTFSIDVNHPCAELTVEPRPAALLPDELLTLRRSLLAVTGYPDATLRQGPVLRPLGGNYYSTANLRLAGPFRPDSVLLRARYGTERRKFLLEPLYDYQFSPGVVKLTCLDPNRLGTLNGAGFPAVLPLGDFAYTEDDFYPQAVHAGASGAPIRRAANYQRVDWRRPAPVLHNPTLTPAGQGRLELRQPEAKFRDSTPRPLYTLLTRPDQPKFQRLQPGLGVLHALPPGRYRVAVLLTDSSSWAPRELVLVEANGQTYYQLQATDRQPAGALSHRINQLLWRLTPRALLDEKAAAPERREIQVQQPIQPQPGWRPLRGRVIDRSSEAGIPGVTVLVKGTTIGTSTATDGSFLLRVPPTAAALLFSSVGYVTQERAIDGYHDTFDVTLVEDVKALNEVVVVGYGVQQRSSVTGSISTVSALQGRVAGVSITSNSGPILIRGNSSLALAEKPLYIVNGLPFNGNVADISPADIQDMKVLKGAAAAGLYGARASNGVIVLTLKKGATVAGQPLGPAQLAGPDAGAALRHRFHDYAWWRPTLTTDAQGQARTTITLPDDVTSWDSFVLASDGSGRLGGSTGRLRSFKALLATLAVPRFLVAGDRVQVLGKAINYQADTAQLTTSFRVAEQLVRRQARRVASAAIDTLTVAAPTSADSLQLSFGLEQPSGYADGEQRTVPVLPLGTRERVGTYAVLTADTILTLPLNPALGEVNVRVESDALPTLLSEIQHLQQYAYLCNEQAASRLLALLLEQRIRTQQHAEFKGQKVVNFLIKKLLAGRHQPEGIWGTWPTSEISPWATVHVTEALLAAEKAGYSVALDRPQLTAYLLRELDASLSPPSSAAPRSLGYFHSNDDQIRLLKLLHDLGATIPYGTYLRRVEAATSRRPPLDRYLALTELRQQLGLSYQLDSLRRYRLRTELGGVCYGDTLRENSYYRYLLTNRLGTTLLAYRLLRAQGEHAAELARIRTYLLGLRHGGYWGSTYETAQILVTIGPDLLVPGTDALTRVQLSGVAGLPVAPVTQFPLVLKLPAGTGPLTLRKEGSLPVYATAYQTRWNPTPAAAAAPFSVTTTLGGQASSHVALPAGRPAELLVTVEAKAEARYVVLEVPIPAGCSYGDPAPTNYLEVHREYLKHQVGIFVDKLPIGKHTFRVALQPRYRGQYTLNPARAELLYFPTKFGRTVSKQVQVK